MSRPVPAGPPALLVVLALLAAAAAALAAPTFPRLSGRVVDEAGILQSEAEARLARALEDHERATGNQVVVATVPTLQGSTVEEYANLLHRHWRLGRAEEDDGALLLVAPSERKVRIESGYGLEGVLTDAAASTIIQSLILPRFRAGDLQGGVETGARGILELLRPDEEGGAAAGREPPAWSRPVPADAAAGGPPWWVVMLAFVTFALVARALNRASDRRGRGRGPFPPTGPYGYGPRRRGRGGWGHGLPPVVVIPGGFGGDGGDRGGGSFGGGGGFSGGGGSSGGGGASGSW